MSKENIYMEPDYKKLYEEKVNQINDLITCGKLKKEVAYSSFPDLKEYRIRENCVRFLEAHKYHKHSKTVLEIDECIDWLNSLSLKAVPKNDQEPTELEEPKECEFKEANEKTEYLLEYISQIPQGLTLQEREKMIIEEILRRNRGNRRLTAEELHISPRTLYRRLSEYGLLDEVN